jgi:DNA-binding CsgD family transcriptional regulator
MRDEKQLSALIADIYDAALSPSLWQDALRGSAAFVGGMGASVYFKDAGNSTGYPVHVFGIEPHYQHLYFDRYARLDPTLIGFFFAEIEAPMAVADVMSYDEFLETRFYREWVQPQGMADSVNAVLDRSATSAACFVVFRHERDGIVDDDARRRMRLIVPHVRRAALVGGVIDAGKVEAETFSAILDGLSSGMFLVDADAGMVHANVAGHAMLEAGGPFRVVDGRLVAADPRTDATLRTMFATAAEGDAAVGVKGIAVQLMARTGERYVAHVLPLTSGERRRAGMDYAAVAAVFVRKAALDVPSVPQVIAKSYRLTPTELRVLLALVEVGGVSEVVATLGIARTTVKMHLRRLFEKTGTGRQADLVKLVAGFASPLAG